MVSIEEMLKKEDLIQDGIDDLIFELIKERKAKGLTQEQFAELSGVDKNTIVLMESFRQNPDLLTVMKLCVALGLSLATKER